MLIVLKRFPPPMDVIALTNEQKIKGRTINLSRLIKTIPIQLILSICFGKKMPQTIPRRILSTIPINILFFMHDPFHEKNLLNLPAAFGVDPLLQRGCSSPEENNYYSPAGAPFSPSIFSTWLIHS